MSTHQQNNFFDTQPSPALPSDSQSSSFANLNNYPKEPPSAPAGQFINDPTYMPYPAYIKDQVAKASSDLFKEYIQADSAKNKTKELPPQEQMILYTPSEKGPADNANATDSDVPEDPTQGIDSDLYTQVDE